MKISNMNGIKSVQDFFELSKKKRVESPKERGDRVEISPAALDHASNKSLQNIVREYLDKIPDVRSDRVAALSGQVGSGYALNREKLEIIADRILQSFGL